MIKVFEYDKIYFNLNEIPTIQKFISYFGVIEQSYMGSLIIRLHNYIFYNCINLYEEYEKYYQQEYDTFFIFLKKVYGFAIDKNITIENQKKYYYTNISCKNDYRIGSILTDNYNNKFREIVINFFKENE